MRDKTYGSVQQGEQVKEKVSVLVLASVALKTGKSKLINAHHFIW